MEIHGMKWMLKKTALLASFAILFGTFQFRTISSKMLDSFHSMPTSIDWSSYTFGYSYDEISPSFVAPRYDLSLIKDIPHPDMNCTTTQSKQQQLQQQHNQYFCCVSWNINVDEWWTHHPDWYIVSETDEDVCFSKYDEPKATFFRRLYRTQWMEMDHANNTFNDQTNLTNHSDDALEIYQRDSLPVAVRNCSNVVQNFQINSGMGASLAAVLNGLYAAHQNNRPYQLTKHREGMNWLFLPKENTSWAWCPSTDLRCYILPVGNCQNTIGVSDPVGRRGDDDTSAWLREYLLRFRHEMRRRIYNATVPLVEKLNKHREVSSSSSSSLSHCTAIHVRRGDSGLSSQPFRRYAALSEYIAAGNISREEPILILSDDETTIYEAEHFYPDYNWVYMDRPRNNISFGGFNGHIPSGDAALEFLVIQAETRAASYCSKLVYGGSGFVHEIYAAYRLAGRSPSETYTVSTAIGKEEAQKYLKYGRHKRATLMIEKIYSEAAMGLDNRMKEYEKKLNKTNDDNTNNHHNVTKKNRHRRRKTKTNE